jgi:hypothetical protein
MDTSRTSVDWCSERGLSFSRPSSCGVSWTLIASLVCLWATVSIAGRTVCYWTLRVRSWRAVMVTSARRISKHLQLVALSTLTTMSQSQ